MVKKKLCKGSCVPRWPCHVCTGSSAPSSHIRQQGNNLISSEDKNRTKITNIMICFSQNAIIDNTSSLATTILCLHRVIVLNTVMSGVLLSYPIMASDPLLVVGGENVFYQVMLLYLKYQTWPAICHKVYRVFEGLLPWQSSKIPLEVEVARRYKLLALLWILKHLRC